MQDNPDIDIGYNENVPEEINPEVSRLYDLHITNDEWSRPDQPNGFFVTPLQLANTFSVDEDDQQTKLNPWTLPVDRLIPTYIDFGFGENINTFIGHLVTGAPMSYDRLRKISVCAQAYIDRVAVISEDGSFTYVFDRDQEERKLKETLRYQSLCNVVLDTYSFVEHFRDVGKSFVNAQLQYVYGRSFYDDDSTAFRISRDQLRLDGNEYLITESKLWTWASTVRWAQMITSNVEIIPPDRLIRLLLGISAVTYGTRILKTDGSDRVIDYQDRYLLPVGNQFVYGLEADESVRESVRFDLQTTLIWVALMDHLTLYIENGAYNRITVQLQAADDGEFMDN